MPELRIRCAEIWGGCDPVDLDVSTSALTASVFSRASGGGRGGDIYYFSVCGTDQLTRIAIADVQGHGAEVSAVSDWLYQLVRDSMDSLQAADILATLNARVLEHGFEAMSTAVLLSYYLGDSRLYYSYAGHPPALAQRIGEDTWTPLTLAYGQGLSNLPLGMLPDVVYHQESVPLGVGDRLLVFSDGLTEYPDAAGLPLGQGGLISRMRAAREPRVSALKKSILEALTIYNAAGLQHDDVTLMAIEIGDREADQPERDPILR